METHNLFHLSILHLFISVASSQSAIKATIRDNTTTLLLPKNETCIVAMKPTLLRAVVKYAIVDVNEEILKDGCNSCYHRIGWMPLLIISKELIRRPYDKKDFPISAKSSLLNGRTLTVSSWYQVFWQIFSLPLTDNAMQVINKGQEQYVDLPDAETVFVAVWNRHGKEIRIDYRFQNEEEVTLQNQIGIAKTGWSIICVNANNLVYEGKYNYKNAKGRRLWLFAYGEISFQVFAMPLEPTDLDKPEVGKTDNSNLLPNDEMFPDKSSPGNPLPITIAVLVTSAVLVVLYSGYRIFLGKKNRARQEGTAATISTHLGCTSEGTSPEEHSGTILWPDPLRPISSHDSENSLYGAVIPR